MGGDAKRGDENGKESELLLMSRERDLESCVEGHRFCLARNDRKGQYRGFLKVRRQLQVKRRKNLQGLTTISDMPDSFASACQSR
jgi:hypothetical protein